MTAPIRPGNPPMYCEVMWCDGDMLYASTLFTPTLYVCEFHYANGMHQVSPSQGKRGITGVHTVQLSSDGRTLQGSPQTPGVALEDWEKALLAGEPIEELQSRRIREPIRNVNHLAAAMRVLMDKKETEVRKRQIPPSAVRRLIKQIEEGLQDDIIVELGIAIENRAAYLGM